MKKYIKVYLPIYIIELVIIGIVGYFLYPFGPLKILIGCSCLAIFCFFWCIKASYNRYKCDILRKQNLILTYLENILHHLRLLVYSNNRDLEKIKALEKEFYKIIQLYKKEFGTEPISSYKEQLTMILNHLSN